MQTLFGDDINDLKYYWLREYDLMMNWLVK